MVKPMQVTGWWRAHQDPRVNNLLVLGVARWVFFGGDHAQKHWQLQRACPLHDIMQKRCLTA